MTLLIFAAFFAVLGIALVLLPLRSAMTGLCLLALSAVLAAEYWLKKKDKARWLRVTLIVLTVICMLAVLGGMTYVHLQGKDDVTAENAPEFVVVLGAQVQGDNPSLTLRKRLDLAAEYLKDNPDAEVIVSGGQGPDEAYTEAFIMSQYLQRYGIEAERIILEEAATNTRENLLFSEELAKERGIPTDRVLIITSEFHMARAKYLARQQGMEPVGLSSKTWPWVLMVNYEVREVFAFVKAFLIKG